MAESFDVVGRTLLRALAEKQAAAYAQMLVYDEGVGGLGIRHPEMFEDMLAWDAASENGHADLLLAALDAIDRVHALHTPRENNRANGWRGDPFTECQTCRAQWPCATVRAIVTGVPGFDDHLDNYGEPGIEPEPDCICGHPCDRHDDSRGECLESGCKCRMYRDPEVAPLTTEEVLAWIPRSVSDAAVSGWLAGVEREAAAKALETVCDGGLLGRPDVRYLRGVAAEYREGTRG